MNEIASPTRLEQPQQAQKPQVRCKYCPTMFTQNRPHQKFCSIKCKNDFHGKMTPEALRRDLDALAAKFNALQAELDRINQAADRRDEALANPP